MGHTVHVNACPNITTKPDSGPNIGAIFGGSVAGVAVVSAIIGWAAFRQRSPNQLTQVKRHSESLDTLLGQFREDSEDARSQGEVQVQVEAQGNVQIDSGFHLCQDQRSSPGVKPPLEENELSVLSARYSAEQSVSHEYEEGALSIYERRGQQELQPLSKALKSGSPGPSTEHYVEPSPIWRNFVFPALMSQNPQDLDFQGNNKLKWVIYSSFEYNDTIPWFMVFYSCTTFVSLCSRK